MRPLPMEGNEQDQIDDLTARRAAVLADPVLRFYQRHGHPAGHGPEVTAAEADEDDDLGTA
jgi:hypothetical protein